jgi:hypothetical protein
MTASDPEIKTCLIHINKNAINTQTERIVPGLDRKVNCRIARGVLLRMWRENQEDFGMEGPLISLLR